MFINSFRYNSLIICILCDVFIYSTDVFTVDVYVADHNYVNYFLSLLITCNIMESSVSTVKIVLTDKDKMCYYYNGKEN